MKFSELVLVTSVLILSSSVNASVINTLNGIEYEWLELTATQGLSRTQVETQLASATEGDALYGYKYASRQLLSDLFLSYASWDGLDGFHGNQSVVSGAYGLISDFGATEYYPGDGGNYLVEGVDGVTGEFQDTVLAKGLYGLESECQDGGNFTCVSTVVFRLDANVPTLVFQYGAHGWDPLSSSPVNSYSTPANLGSYLVKTTVVPVPTAVWLFGSGLIGLVGFARRKKA